MFTVGIDMITNSSPPSDAAGWFALDVKSKGLLHLLCSNRSLAHLNLGDTSAAIQDAEACCQARPGFAQRLPSAPVYLDLVSSVSFRCVRFFPCVWIESLSLHHPHQAQSRLVSCASATDSPDGVPVF